MQAPDGGELSFTREGVSYIANLTQQKSTLAQNMIQHSVCSNTMQGAPVRNANDMSALKDLPKPGSCASIENSNIKTRTFKKCHWEFYQWQAE